MSTPNQQALSGKNHLELVLNLLHSRRTSSADADAARSRAQALVMDVLKSRLDVETEAGNGNFLRARGFTDAGKALAASRALQIAFEGFRATAEGARTSISMVLDCITLEEAISRGSVLSVEQKELFSLARSSRVLITQALYDHATGCQLLKLRSFSPRAGVYEFLWTSEERLDELQAETDFVTEPALQSQPFHNDTDATVVQRAVTNPRIAAISQPAEQRPEEPAIATERPAERTYAQGVEPQAKRSRVWVIALACSAAVLIAAGGLVFWRPGTAPPAPQPAQIARTQASPPVVRHQPPAPTLAPEVAAKPAPKQNAPLNPVPRTTLQTTLKGTGEAKPQKSKNPACSSEVAASISYYLGLAGKNRNQGNLDDAEREYQQVIDCEPSNREARQGLMRVKADRN